MMLGGRSGWRRMLVDDLIFSDWVDNLVFSNEEEQIDVRKRRRTLMNKGTIWRRDEERWWTEEWSDKETKNSGRMLELRLDARKKKNAGSNLHEEERTQGRRSETQVFKTRVLKVKLEFHVDFLPHQLPPLTNWDLQTRVLSWNSSFRHSRC